MVPNPGGVVYGTIAVGALLAAESAGRESYLETAGAVAITMVAYWLAHAYSEITASRLEHNEPLKLDAVARTLAHELMIVVGAVIPLLTLLICWAVGAHLTSAVTTATWTSAATIVLVEVVAGVRAKLAARALMAQTTVGALFGLLVMLLKFVLH